MNKIVPAVKGTRVSIPSRGRCALMYKHRRRVSESFVSGWEAPSSSPRAVRRTNRAEDWQEQSMSSRPRRMRSPAPRADPAGAPGRQKRANWSPGAWWSFGPSGATRNQKGARASFPVDIDLLGGSPEARRTGAIAAGFFKTVGLGPTRRAFTSMTAA